MQQTQTNKCFL